MNSGVISWDFPGGDLTLCHGRTPSGLGLRRTRTPGWEVLQPSLRRPRLWRGTQYQSAPFMHGGRRTGDVKDS
eukprot:632989-Prymnesium_polylepis.1